MLSFIVPAYNEEAELPATLRTLRRAADASGEEYEIIVVDDASTDRTREIAMAAGAHVVAVNRRQIAAVRNAGASAARGEVLFFVDADTHISPKHVAEALGALASGYVGGSAPIRLRGDVPAWARVFARVFTTLYFAANLGAGAFLFLPRHQFDAIGGFDEQYYAGEEVFFTQALKERGRFKLLGEPISTSGRKLRMHSAREVLVGTFKIIVGGKTAVRSRDKLDFWYDGKREGGAA
jgi:glycosyltransferase involved in cell wall biosynthesis